VDEIKCPNCGKANPEVLLKCRYCGTELPASAELHAGPEAPSAPTLNLPETTVLGLPKDWEKSLAASDKAEQPQEAEADWLRRLRGDIGEAAPASANAAADTIPDDQPAPGLDNWLSGLREQDAGPTPEADQSGAFVPTTEEAELPDWLKAMPSPDAEPSALDSAPQAEMASEGGEADDWLKSFEPLTPASSPPATSSLADWQNIQPSATPEEDDDSDAWLKSFADQAPQTAPPSGFSNYRPPGAAEDEADTEPKAEVSDDEWMKSLGAAQDTLPTLGLDDFQKLAETPVTEEADDSDAWLKSLTALATSESETAVAESSDSLPDWLNAPTPPAPTVSAEGIPPVSDTDDWLKTFGQIESAPQIAPQSDTPDWLKEPPSSASEAKPEPDLTQWLSSVGGVVGGSAGAAPESGAPEAATPTAADDWLKSFKEAAKSDPETAEAARTGVLPDWLRSITDEAAPGGATPSTPSSSTSPAAPAGGASNLPDWLQSFKDTAKSDPATAGAAQTGALPDWLADLGGTPAGGSTQLPTENLPDWLKSASGPTPETPGAPPPADLPEWILSPDSPGGPTTPDWFGDVQSKKKPDTGKIDSTVVDPFALQSPAGSTPAIVGTDWLDSLKADAPPASETPAFEGLGRTTTGQTSQLDWLKGLTPPPTPSGPTTSEVDFQIGGESQPPPTKATTGPLTSSDLPAWLTEPQPAPTESPEASVPAFSSDLPDWLTAPPAEMTTAEALPTTTPFTEGISMEPMRLPEPSNLARADLPGWLGAMRPVSVPTGLNLGLDYEETAGPLAGLRGILPAESAIAVPGKPGAVVTRFAVSDLEQQQADIFRNIIAEESQEVEAKPVRKQRFNFAWDRLLVALLVLALMALPFAGLVPAGLFADPSRDLSAQAKAQTLFDSVANLPAGQPVLVAFEYDPASAGELTPGASALLQQLAQRGLEVRAVSTYPAGVGVAQSLLSETSEVNYIPGGAVGLRKFVTDPGSSLNDVSAIMVVTGSTESTQAWLEQVQTATGKKMVVITSAAAEPLLLPYTQSGQLAALISGLSGGMAYQSKVTGDSLASDPVATSQWEAYTLSLNGASLILLAGGFIGGVMMLLNRRGEPKPVKQAGQKQEPQSELKRRKPKKKKAAKKGSAAKATKKK